MIELAAPAETVVVSDLRTLQCEVVLLLLGLRHCQLDESKAGSLRILHDCKAASVRNISWGHATFCSQVNRFLERRVAISNCEIGQPMRRYVSHFGSWFVHAARRAFVVPEGGVSH